jgi:aldehyde dehydrogenase (NAD+)
VNAPQQGAVLRLEDSRLYIDGQWQERAGALRLAVVAPHTEQVVGHVAAGTAADVDLAVAAARRAFDSFSRSTVQARVELLGRIVALLEARAETFAQALVTEMGAAISFARAAQVPFAIEHVRVQMQVLRQYAFMKQEGALAIAKEPIGVCALITPWNWPLYQITAKVAPAIAAGCTVVLKPSELSPYSAQLFAQVMHDAGVPAGVFNLVGGSGEVVGAALAAHPDVDMISITGSTRAGVLVAQAAAVSVKRVVQELGGKSPNVFLDDADFTQGVAKGVLAGMRNVGQSCSAPTRMLVPVQRLAEVEALAAAAAAGIQVGNPHDTSTTMGPVANAAQYGRVQAMIEAGRPEARLFRASHRLLGRGLGHAHCARRNLRPGAGHHSLPRRRRGHRHRQRHGVRPGRAPAVRQRRACAPRGRAHTRGPGAHQLPGLEWARAIWRLQTLRQRPRIRRLRFRGISGNQGHRGPMKPLYPRTHRFKELV